MIAYGFGIGFLLGIFVGAAIGVVVMGLLVAARDADERAEQTYRRKN